MGRKETKTPKQLRKQQARAGSEKPRKNKGPLWKLERAIRLLHATHETSKQALEALTLVLSASDTASSTLSQSVRNAHHEQKNVTAQQTGIQSEPFGLSDEYAVSQVLGKAWEDSTGVAAMSPAIEPTHSAFNAKINQYADLIQRHEDLTKSFVEHLHNEQERLFQQGGRLTETGPTLDGMSQLSHPSKGVEILRDNAKSDHLYHGATTHGQVSDLADVHRKQPHRRSKGRRPAIEKPQYLEKLEIRLNQVEQADHVTDAQKSYLKGAAHAFGSAERRQFTLNDRQQHLLDRLEGVLKMKPEAGRRICQPTPRQRDLATKGTGVDDLANKMDGMFVGSEPFAQHVKESGEALPPREQRLAKTSREDDPQEEEL